MNKLNRDTIIIDGIEYVRKDSFSNNEEAEKLNDMPYCIVRTYSAGVFVAYLESMSGKNAVLRKARRLWYWSGAASLSQLAVDGTKDPDNCKFPCEVDKIGVTEVIEVLYVTAAAMESIKKVPVWEVQ